MATAVNSNALPVGYRLGEYVVESVLGHGGFGITYLAKDTQLSSRVAIKEYFPQSFATRNENSTIVPRTDTTPTAADNYRWGLEEFLKEARALAHFKHNNIVRVLRFLEANGTAYMVMEYEAGESLSAYLRRHGGFLDERTLLSVFIPILTGLQAVHDAGMLHLDIKPDNIYLRANGTPMLIDFGSASRVSGSGEAKRKIALTPAYSAIENYPNIGEQGAWSDVYSLGATLYRCITSKQPADALTRYKAHQANQPDPLVPATDFDRPFYASHIRECVNWAMRLNPDERARSAYAVQRGLMGHGLSNELPAQRKAPNYRAGYIDLPKNINTQASKAKPKRRYWERNLIALLFFFAFLVFVVQAGFITMQQLEEGYRQTWTGLKQTVVALPERFENLLRPKPKVAAAPAPVVADVTAPPIRPAYAPPREALKTLTGHAGHVASLAFLAGGRWLASGDARGTIRIWDVETDAVLHTLRNRKDEVILAASPDGQWLASNADKNAIRLWNTNDAVETTQFTGHQAPIRRLAFSSDNRLLASAGMDRKVYVWELETRARLLELPPFEVDVLSLAFSPNGRWLATGESNGAIRYWSTSTGKMLGTFQASEEAITIITFSPDGRWLASGGGQGFLKLWATGSEDGDRPLSGAPETVYALAFSPDSQWLFAAGSVGGIRQWDLKTDEMTEPLMADAQAFYAMALSPLGSLMAVGGVGHTVNLWTSPAQVPVPSDVELPPTAPEQTGETTGQRSAALPAGEYQ